jgi:hypothetical protein
VVTLLIGGGAVTFAAFIQLFFEIAREIFSCRGTFILFGFCCVSRYNVLGLSDADKTITFGDI